MFDKANKIFRIHTDLSSVCLFLAATKQLYEWFSPSVCLSVRMSVRPSVSPSHLFDYGHIIVLFSEIIINGRSDVHTKGQGHESKVKVTEAITWAVSGL